MELNEKQKKQEEQYSLPYHWFLERASFGGRVYFGYLDLVLEFLGKDLRGQRILDAGCGDGRITFEILKRGAEVYGVDFSERAISFAKNLVPKANFIVPDIKKMPFEENFFDKIVLIGTLEHINPSEIPQLLKELKRVLKKEGELIITVPSNLAPFTTKHFQHFSENQIRKILSKFFKIQKIIGQDKDSLLFKNLYRLVENRFWQIKPLAKFFNLFLYPRYLSRCSPNKAKRLVVVCQK